MWRLAKSTSYGGNSIRSIFTVVLTAFVTITAVLLLSLFVVSHPVNAEDAGSATWSDDALIYEGRTFVGPAAPLLVKELKLPEGTQAYIAEEQGPQPQAGGSNSANSPPDTYHVIYFAEGTEASAVSSAQYRTYEVNRSTTGIAYQNPSAPQSISIDNSTYGDTNGGGSCQVPGGLSWIICPASDFLATAVDWSYTQLAAFLAVQPLNVTNPNDSMYTAWNISRSIANIAFLIAFLVIIYSYVTNLGISNYGLKKMIPRLIIAAVAVNLSFFICAVFIDASNILGYSIQDVFMAIRNDLFNNPGDVANAGQDWNWELLTAGVLSGGVGLGALALGTYGSPVSFVYMLLPLLVGVALIGLVILLILAARQAIIVILVIIAPLAFVAYLLPNTEKMFERWRGLFVTMLVFFPIFSLVFGGAQLAGALTIQNASNVAMVILGLAIQIAPLVIMPIILRFSGGLLGKIAGIINNPSKGLLDRTKNWSKARQDAHKYNTGGKFRNRKNMVSASKKALEEAKKRHEANPTDATARELKAQQRHHKRTVARSRFRATNTAARFGTWTEMSAYKTEKLKESGQNEIKAYNQDRLTQTRAGQDMIRRDGLAHHAVEESKALQGVIVDEMFAGQSKTADEILQKRNVRASARYKAVTRATMERAVHMDYESRIISSASIIAKGEQEQNYANAINTTGIEKQLQAARESGATPEAVRAIEHRLAEATEMLSRAGGISRHGKSRALANAKITIDEALSKAIKNIEETSGIEAGDLVGFEAAFDKAVRENDLAGMVAFSNKMSVSADAGVKSLRNALRSLEAGFQATRTADGRQVPLSATIDRAALSETITDFKQFMNASSTVNAVAEDVATWSRDPQHRSLATIGDGPEVWQDLNANAFAGNKKSSQILAMRSGAIDKERAENILSNPGARGNLKPSVIRMLTDIKDGNMTTAEYNRRMDNGYYDDPTERDV